MIRQILSLSPKEHKACIAFCERSVYGMKALGPYLSYGLDYDFVRCYEQVREDGERIAFLTKCYGTVSVACVPESVTEEEIEELRAFLSVLQYSVLAAPEEITGEQPTACIMCLPRGVLCKATPASLLTALHENENLKEFYQLLTVNNPGYFAENFDDWYVDFSHRIRHGTAHSVLLEYGGSYSATAAALIVSEHAVFLGAISTNREVRGKHFAWTCIRALTDRYGDKRIYLLCKPDKQAFYEYAGMVKIGTYSERTKEK